MSALVVRSVWPSAANSAGIAEAEAGGWTREVMREEGRSLVCSQAEDDAAARGRAAARDAARKAA